MLIPVHYHIHLPNTTQIRRLFIFILFISFISIHETSNAQGCVAIRSTGGFGNSVKSMQNDTAAKWEFSTNARYFKSFRHYVGTAEQKQRQVLGNEVINHSYTQDLNLTRILNPRWSVMVDMPILGNSRSQTYTEKSVLTRFATH